MNLNPPSQASKILALATIKKIGDLEDGYYSIRLPNSDDREYAHLHRGDLAVYVTIGPQKGTRELVTAALLLLDRGADSHILAIAELAKAKWTPITKSEFVEALDQYLPE